MIWYQTIESHRFRDGIQPKWMYISGKKNSQKPISKPHNAHRYQSGSFQLLEVDWDDVSFVMNSYWIRPFKDWVVDYVLVQAGWYSSCWCQALFWADATRLHGAMLLWLHFPKLERERTKKARDLNFWFQYVFSVRTRHVFFQRHLAV